MSAVIATPELMLAAATDLSAIGSTLSAAHLKAAPPTLSVLPAAADEVSASVAHLFSGHARDYQKLAEQTAAFHEQFVQHLTASAHGYASAEAANVALLQPLTAIAGSVAGAALTAQTILDDIIATFLGTVQFLIALPFLLPFLPIVILAYLFLAYLAANGVSIFPPYTV
ncbi:MAG: PE family protein [Mycobacterium sp.]|nr:MAG: PE family protein [Mycobacterium sp.]